MRPTQFGNIEKAARQSERKSSIVENLREKLIKKKGGVLKLPYVVLITLLILTTGVTLIFHQNAVTKDGFRFDLETNRIQNTLENRIGLYIALLKSGRGFIESSKNLNRAEFFEYFGNLELVKNYPGLQGIGYSKIYQPADSDDLIKKIRDEGNPDFRIFPLTNNDLTQTVLYFEPNDELNRSVVGFDMSSDPARRDALLRAASSGEAAATGKISLLQDRNPDRLPGFLIYLPIFRPAEKDKKELTGFIYIPFQAKAFLEEVQQITDSQNISVKIFDADNQQPENLLAETAAPKYLGMLPAIPNDFTAQSHLDVAGRKWIVTYQTMPDFSEQSSVAWTPAIFLVGLIFSLLIFGITYWESAAHAKMQAIASDLFESEKQKRQLLIKEQEARITAEQANSAKDEFIAVVSHELRTPLNAIAGWTRILKFSHLTEEKRIGALNKIETNLRQQAGLVEDLIGYSQLLAESSENNASREEFIFSDVYQEVFENIKPIAERKNIELSNNNRLNGQKINGDPEKIKTLIHNLLGNALKFTPEGGCVETELFKDEANHKINWIVRDNGIGIEPDFLPHIFEQFTQADTSITRRYGGLGLGLAVSRHIIEIFHGTVEARSEGIGKGTEFIVRIPYQENIKSDNL